METSEVYYNIYVRQAHQRIFWGKYMKETRAGINRETYTAAAETRGNGKRNNSYEG